MTVADARPTVAGPAAPAALAGTASLGLAVTAAGVTVTVVGLAVRAAATVGPWRDAGTTLLVAGLVVAVAGVSAQVAPTARRRVIGSPRPVATGFGAPTVAVLAAVAVLAGASVLAGGSRPVADRAALAGPSPVAGSGAVVPVAVGSPSPAGAPGGAGSATAGGTGGLGAVLAAQGRGSNGPPPSVEGVEFPSGGRGRFATTAAPWGAAGSSPVAPSDGAPGAGSGGAS